jgi:hypothetical protein
LREPGETGTDAPAEIVPRRVPPESRDVGLDERARADRAHLPSQYVDELRELVETGGAQEPAGASDPPVAHRTELENGETPPPGPEPLLTKEHRAAIVEHDDEGDDGHDGSEEHQAADRAGHVEEPLHGSPASDRLPSQAFCCKVV